MLCRNQLFYIQFCHFFDENMQIERKYENNFFLLEDKEMDVIVDSINANTQNLSGSFGILTP